MGFVAFVCRLCVIISVFFYIGEPQLWHAATGLCHCGFTVSWGSTGQRQRNKATGCGSEEAPVTPVSIQGNNVDIVQDCKYLGVHIDTKLVWAKNTDSLYRKSQSRLVSEAPEVHQHLPDYAQDLL